MWSNVCCEALRSVHADCSSRGGGQQRDNADVQSSRYIAYREMWRAGLDAAYLVHERTGQLQLGAELDQGLLKNQVLCNVHSTCDRCEALDQAVALIPCCTEDS